MKIIIIIIVIIVYTYRFFDEINMNHSQLIFVQLSVELLNQVQPNYMFNNNTVQNKVEKKALYTVYSKIVYYTS